MLLHILTHFPVGNHMFKANNKNTRTRREICSKLTVKTPERQWRRSSVFIVNFEHISTPCFSVFIANFEQVNSGSFKAHFYTLWNMGLE